MITDLWVILLAQNTGVKFVRCVCLWDRVTKSATKSMSHFLFLLLALLPPHTHTHTQNLMINESDIVCATKYPYFIELATHYHAGFKKSTKFCKIFHKLNWRENPFILLRFLSCRCAPCVHPRVSGMVRTETYLLQNIINNNTTVCMVVYQKWFTLFKFTKANKFLSLFF